MMEFTFDGMVRSGYGFYNPNHAAALICALLPFLWEWCYRTADRKLLRLIPLLLTLLLTAALVFTFSRTGMAVMILEGILFGVLKRKIGWKWIGAFAIVTLLLLALSGMWMRFRIDEAVMNRPKIWLAGLQLSAANPLGVGWGNSGRLASAFLLPDWPNTECSSDFSGSPVCFTPFHRESEKQHVSVHWPACPFPHSPPRFSIRGHCLISGTSEIFPC